jgi:peptidylprolyl isomerase
MRVRDRLASTLLITLALSATCRASDHPAKPTEAAMQKTDAKPTTTASGLQYIDFKVGDGASPKQGQTAIVHYTGWLDDGTKFDSSRDHGKPFGFKVGMGQVIKAWDEGVASMKIGGTRRLIVPPELGYGARGAGKVIPPNARLTFDVELLEIRP